MYAARQGSLVPIYRFPQFSAFGPETTKAMRTAFQDALRELRVTDWTDPIAQIVALKIMEIARLGERDPVRIRELALKDMRSSSVDK